eukprot:gene9023-16146_t
MESQRDEHPSEFDGHTSRIRCQRRSENHAREEDTDLRAALELMKEERARLQQKLEEMLTTQIQNDKQQEEPTSGGGAPRLEIVIDDGEENDDEVTRAMLSKLNSKSAILNLLVRFCSRNPRFIGTVREFNNSLRTFNKKEYDNLVCKRLNRMDAAPLHGGTLAQIMKNNVVQTHSISPTKYMAIQTAEWTVALPWPHATNNVIPGMGMNEL